LSKPENRVWSCFTFALVAAPLIFTQN